MNFETLDFIDLPLVIFYLSLVIISMYIYQNNSSLQNSHVKKFFIPGYLAKTLGGIAILLVYKFYYPGGDIYEYYNTSSSLYKLTFLHFDQAMKILFTPISRENYSFFNHLTGFPSFEFYFDRQTFTVSRLSYIFVLLSFNRVIPTIILLNLFLYLGPWKMFRTLSTMYPHANNALAFAILFLPSTIFWGSGIMKDSYTLTATTYISASLIQWVILKKFSFRSLVGILFFSYVLIAIKPYIFVSLLAFTFVLTLYAQLKHIHNRVLKYLVAPFLLVMLVFFIIFIYMSLSKYLGVYGSIESLLEKAAITQKDYVSNPNYSKNYFNIGYFEPTLPGILSKIHLALLYGLYSPFLWVARNPLMLLSALETLFFAITSILFLWKIITKKDVFYVFVSDPILSSFFIFTIIFIIFVGLSTANYGSLVRYRIPALPFFICYTLIVLKSSHVKSDYQKAILS